jgi:tetratricopeptide (TPR) repeat protein
MRTMRYSWLPGALLALLVSGCGGRDADVEAALTQGREALAQADDARAAEAFAAAVKAAPVDLEARLALGDVLERRQDRAGALAQYAVVLKEDPEHREALRRSAQLLLAESRADETRAMVETLQRLDPDSADTLALQAALALAEGAAEDARAKVHEALKHEPGHINASVLLASLSLREGDRKAADAALEAALTAHPDDPALRSLLVRIYREQGRLRQQQAQLEALIALQPGALAPRVQLAGLFEARNKPDRARATLEAAVDAISPPHSAAATAKLSLIAFMRRVDGVDAATARLQSMIDDTPDDIALRVGLARFHEQNAQLAQARLAWQRVIEKAGAPDSPLALEAQTRIAAVSALLGERDDARASLAAVLKAAPTYPEAHMLRGTLHLDDGNPTAAIEDFEAVLAKRPDDPRAIRALARARLANNEAAAAEAVLEEAITRQPGQLDFRAELASLRTVRGDLKGAVEALDGILKRAPDNAGALEALFRIRMYQRDWAGAHAAAQRAKTALPESPLGFHLDGLAYQAEGKPKDSLPQFESALALAPDAIQPLTQAVRSHLALGDKPRALARLAEALEQNQDNYVALNLQGEMKLATRDYAAASADFARAISLRKDLDIFYRNLAAAELGAGKEGAALATLRRGINATGGSALLVTALASHYEKTGRLDEAIAEYEAILADQPNSELALNNLAMLLAEYRGDPASLGRASALLAKIVTRDNPAYQDTRGWVLYRQGDFPAAVSALREAAEGLPDTPMVQYHLGMALLKSGNAVDAKAALTRATEGNQEFRGRKEAAKALASLR